MTRTFATFMLAAVMLVSSNTASAAPDTVFGMSEGTSTLAAQDKKFGHVDVARVFNNGAPKAWANMPKRSSIVSFKMPARSVVEGEWDGFLRNWFRTAPTGYPVWWAYWHEPYDNYSGAAAQRLYKEAWRHIVTIERNTAPANLKATFITTLGLASNGKWDLHYPGDKWIDVLGWDGKLHTWDKRYVPAKEHYAAAVRASRQHNKPWGIAEGGSVVFSRNYQGRAQWIRDTARWAQNSGARFFVWWPEAMSRNGALQDHRLNDQPSIDAWRWVMRGRWM